MFRNATLACLSLVAVLLVGQTGAHAQPKRPGPSLKVVVYVSDTQNPIHGATVTITDAWGYFDQVHSYTDTTNARGEARFGPAAFKYWTIARGRMYRGQDPWDWVAVPGEITGVSSGSINGQEHRTVRRSPPVMGEFKVTVKVEKAGFRAASGSAVVTRAGAVATFYLSDGRGATGSRPRRQPPVEPRLITDIHEQTDARSFSMGSNAKIRLDWPNGRPAVSATLSHTHIVREAKPNGPGLWLSVYAFNHQGQSNVFQGSRDILLANTATGETAVREGRSYQIDCGDLIIEYQLNPFRWNPPQHAGWAGNFEGTLRMTARMRVAPPMPPAAMAEGSGSSAVPVASSTPTGAPPATQVAFCSNCGARLPPGAAFCPSCGTKVIRPVTPVRKSSTAWPFDANEAKRRQRETAGTLGVPEKLSINLGGGVTMDFVLIPAGDFMMGSPTAEADRHDDEQLHRVTISHPYYLAATEVTQAQWRAVMGTTLAQQRDKDSVKGPLPGQGATYPMYFVSWEEAAEFCGRVSRRVGRQVCLPTEAEWEYACRAGTNSRYPSGDTDNQLDLYAWYKCKSASLSDSQAHPVRRKRPNAFGLHDMQGNLCEWCSDRYTSDYAADTPTDPQGPQTGDNRVNRGGGFSWSSRYCRSASRRRFAPYTRHDDVGFRPALLTSERASSVSSGEAGFEGERGSVLFQLHMLGD